MLEKMFFLCLGFIILTACSADQQKLRDELLKVDSDFSDYSVKNGFEKAFIEFAHSEATMLPENEEPVVGLEAVKAHFAEESGALMEWEPLYAEASSSGDIGWTWGTYTMTVKLPDNSEQIFTGKYTSIWKKTDDGNWKWVHDMGNMDRATQTVKRLPEKFDPQRDPVKDLELAKEIAKKDGKRIILDVGGEWCIWCHRIDDFILANNELNNFISNNFVVLKINYSEENKNEKFLSGFASIPGFPHFFVLDENGKLLHSQDTALLEKDKSYDFDKFMAFVKQWAKS
ncbi:MAG: thioredoxin family protein [Ignavibacteriales bacterium]|nr:thioredoxin family protein [Ignavibacteriales bacterium]MCF8306556.1 thioredoxin family protein [Ignavibacteriales bacterium]MCF8316355.1 thioredoxin family protein [Ignavibacteriales bacterium]MCF8437687.1 thioredoxin family protein [Ignavibacteriales bacterium]